ncbi:TetR/AcrR family transcriptional regulator [Ilumatobacter sp.]|uniref:TetR/AcrR family transcriptional regulator n=1 Tax=Ilumatobacter sp. TaxID=1967498 RepID=UPI003AF804A7
MGPSDRTAQAEARILDAAKSCCERWGIEKVTVDDVVSASGVSRATLYRLFPGGKDVMFDALHARERAEFFDTLTAEVGGTDDFEDLVVRLVVTATRELRDDRHLAIMLASEPGAVLSELTVDGMPQIIRVANDYLGPILKPFLDPEFAEPLIDLLVRITISYFLAPSEHVDLGHVESARAFLRPGLSVLSASIRQPVISDHT